MDSPFFPTVIVVTACAAYALVTSALAWRGGPRAAWLGWAAVAGAGAAALALALARQLPPEVVPAWRSAAGAAVITGLPTAAATGAALRWARRRGAAAAAAAALAAMLVALPVAGLAAVSVSGVSEVVHAVQ